MVLTAFGIITILHRLGIGSEQAIHDIGFGGGSTTILIPVCRTPRAVVDIPRDPWPVRRERLNIVQAARVSSLGEQGAAVFPISHRGRRIGLTMLGVRMEKFALVVGKLAGPLGPKVAGELHRGRGLLDVNGAWVKGHGMKVRAELFRIATTLPTEPKSTMHEFRTITR